MIFSPFSAIFQETPNQQSPFFMFCLTIHIFTITLYYKIQAALLKSSPTEVKKIRYQPI